MLFQQQNRNPSYSRRSPWSLTLAGFISTKMGICGIRHGLQYTFESELKKVKMLEISLLLHLKCILSILMISEDLELGVIILYPFSVCVQK